MHNIFKIIRYIISGGTAAIVDLVILYMLVEKLNITYILSAVIAFLVAFIVSFTLQKYWTFGDDSKKINSQASKYFLVSAINLILNTILVFLFVEFLGLHYIISQIITSGLIALSSFYIYSLFIFRNNPQEIPNIENIYNS